MNAFDDRRKLTWKSRFANTLAHTDMYNFYSAAANGRATAEDGDEVLELANGTPSTLGNLFSDLGRYTWHMQETHKGRFSASNPDPAATSWAGWGFAYDFTVQETSISSTWTPQVSGPGFFCYTVYYNFIQREVMLLTELGEHPVFRRNPSEMFTNSIPDVAQNEILAKGIPALSAAAGKTAMGSLPNPGQRNFNMNTGFKPEGGAWGRSGEPYDKRWLHSDMKDMAFFCTHKLFKTLVELGDLE